MSFFAKFFDAAIDKEVKKEIYSAALVIFLAVYIFLLTVQCTKVPET